MSIEEAIQTYGTKEYTTGVGDTLVSVCRKVYDSEDRVCQSIFKYLNPRYDWHEIRTNSTLYYIPVIVSSDVDIESETITSDSVTLCKSY